LILLLFAASPARAAIQFYSDADNFIDFGDRASMQITSDMTIMFQVKFTSAVLGSFVFGKSNASGSRSYGFQVESNGRQNFFIASDGSTLFNLRAGVNMVLNKWQTYVFRYTPSTVMSIELDGVVIASTTASVPAAQYTANSNSLLLNSRPGLSSVGHSMEMASFAFWNATLSDNEREILGKGKVYYLPRLRPANLLLYTNFDDQAGSGNTVTGTIRDLSGNGNTGSLTGTMRWTGTGISYP
jgi:hypothetical protein